MSLRAPELEDATAVAAAAARFFPDPISPDTMRRAWTQPGFDRARDARVAVSEDGRIQGYADAEAVGDDGRRSWIWLLGEPADDLAQWAEARAAELARPPARVFASAWSENERGKHALEHRGFRLVRHSYRMAIDLDREPAAPVWPDGVSVRTLRHGDERTFYEVHQETFEDHWEHASRAYDEWAHWMLAPGRHRPELWYLAIEGGEPAGISICSLDEVDEDVGWVAILGVRRPWRRRGVGRALLLHSFAEFHRRGCRRVQLGVDADSLTGAHLLYESAGMHVVHRFDMYEKTL